jgi:methylmalonyl-CoA carboxyltransferase 5S subunit
MKAIEAGADIVDTSISSMSLGPGHNPTESLVEMLEGTPTPRLDKDRLPDQGPLRAGPAALRGVRVRIVGVETEIFDSQIPGGMISNMESQLKQQGAGDRVREVLAEVPRVRKDAGYPPLVTPSSQIVGTQAVFNVLMGRYKVLTGEFADLMLGYYGETSASASRRSSRRRRRTPRRNRSPAGRPTCSSRSGRSSARAALALPGCDGSDEDVLTYAMFPQVAPSSSPSGPGPKNPAWTSPVAAARRRGGGAGRQGNRAVSTKVTYDVRIGETTRSRARRAPPDNTWVGTDELTQITG